MSRHDLKAWRKARKWTQPQAAEYFRCSLRTYKNWELGTIDVPGIVALVTELQDAVDKN